MKKIILKYAPGGPFSELVTGRKYGEGWYHKGDGIFQRYDGTKFVDEYRRRNQGTAATVDDDTTEISTDGKTWTTAGSDDNWWSNGNRYVNLEDNVVDPGETVGTGRTGYWDRLRMRKEGTLYDATTAYDPNGKAMSYLRAKFGDNVNSIDMTSAKNRRRIAKAERLANTGQYKYKKETPIQPTATRPDGTVIGNHGATSNLDGTTSQSTRKADIFFKPTANSGSTGSANSNAWKIDGMLDKSTYSFGKNKTYTIDLDEAKNHIAKSIFGNDYNNEAAQAQFNDLWSQLKVNNIKELLELVGATNDGKFGAATGEKLHTYLTNNYSFDTTEGKGSDGLGNGTFIRKINKKDPNETNGNYTYAKHGTKLILRNI